MTDLPPELKELVDRQKIYAVLTSYCRAIDRGDVDLMKTVYWEDGTDDHGVFQGNAMDFAETVVMGIQHWFEKTMHMIGNVHMEIDGAAASVESYLFAYHRVKADAKIVRSVFGERYADAVAAAVRAGTGQDFLYGGRYADSFEKRGEVWRIKKRVVIMDWTVNQPSSAIVDQGMFRHWTVVGRRDRQDPIYQRP